jgi:predicted transposase/invertase (TIGR01784 family)
MKIFNCRSSLCWKFQRKYDPLNDFLFYKIFGEKGDEVQLLGFLNAVLGKAGDDRFTSVTILEDKTLTAEFLGDKTSILDVKAILQGKTKVNVEVQIRNEHNMEKRSLFYWSKEFTRDLKKGQDYSELPNVLTINIVDFDYLKTSDFHSCFHLRDDKERDIILTEALEIHFINMVRYRKMKGKDKLNDPLCRWLAWLDRNSKPEVLEEIVKMDTSILSANDRFSLVIADEEEQAAYARREKAMFDEGSRTTGTIRMIARKLKEMEVSPEKIHAATGLSLEDIEDL